MSTHPAITERCLEKDGPVDPLDEFSRGAIMADHFFARAEDGRLYIQADNYHPDPPESWDVDKWESKSCYLVGDLSRPSWKLLHRVARALTKHDRIIYKSHFGSMIMSASGGIVYTFT